MGNDRGGEDMFWLVTPDECSCCIREGKKGSLAMVEVLFEAESGGRA